jgi:hypothetical protein
MNTFTAAETMRNPPDRREERAREDSNFKPSDP